MIDSGEGCAIGIVLGFFLFGFAIGFFGGKGEGRKAEREDAIAAGVAEWRVDAKTGQTTFHYLSK